MRERTPIRPVRTMTPDTVTDIPVHRLSVPLIRYFAHVAMDHARNNPHDKFQVIAKGWGHPHRIVAAMFDYCPDNVGLPYEFIYPR